MMYKVCFFAKPVSYFGWLQSECAIFAAHQRSCGKVMFSVVSVYQSFCPGRGSHITWLRMIHWTSGPLFPVIKPLSPRQDLSVKGLLGTHPSMDMRLFSAWISLYRDPRCTSPTPLPHSRHIQTCSLWSRYGRQESGLHPTEMLSGCFDLN